MAGPLRDGFERSLGAADLTGGSRTVLDRLTADIREAGSGASVGGGRLASLVEPIVPLATIDSSSWADPAAGLSRHAGSALRAAGAAAGRCQQRHGRRDARHGRTVHRGRRRVRTQSRSHRDALRRRAHASGQRGHAVWTLSCALPPRSRRRLRAGSVVASMSGHDIRVEAGARRRVSPRAPRPPPANSRCSTTSWISSSACAAPDPFHPRRSRLTLRLEAPSASMRGPAGAIVPAARHCGARLVVGARCRAPDDGGGEKWRQLICAHARRHARHRARRGAARHQPLLRAGAGAVALVGGGPHGRGESRAGRGPAQHGGSGAGARCPRSRGGARLGRGARRHRASARSPTALPAALGRSIGRRDRPDRSDQRLTCGRASGCTDVTRMAATAERPWGANNPWWRPFLYGPLARCDTSTPLPARLCRSSGSETTAARWMATRWMMVEARRTRADTSLGPGRWRLATGGASTARLKPSWRDSARLRRPARPVCRAFACSRGECLAAVP